MTLNSAIATTLTLLVLLGPWLLALWRGNVAARRARAAAAAGGGEPTELGPEVVLWSWEQERTVHQVRHQGLLPVSGALAALLTGGMLSAVLLGFDRPFPGVPSFVEWMDLEPTRASFAAGTLLLTGLVLGTSALLGATIAWLAGGPSGAFRTVSGATMSTPPSLSERNVWLASPALRQIGYLDHHRLLQPASVGVAQLGSAVLVLVSVAAATLVPAPATAAWTPLLASGFLAATYALGAWLLPPGPCWSAAPRLATPVEERPQRVHLLEHLAALKWDVPARGVCRLLQVSRALPEPTPPRQVLGAHVAQFRVPAGPHECVTGLPWTREFLPAFVALWRPEWISDSPPLAFSGEAARAASRQQGATVSAVDPRPVQVLHGPAGSGRAAAVRWLALHEVLLRAPSDLRREGRIGRALIIVPECRSDDARRRHPVQQQLGAVNTFLDQVREQAAEVPLPRAGSDATDDLCVLGLGQLVAELIRSPAGFRGLTFVGVLDVDLFEDIERAQLREALRALDVMTALDHAPNRPTAWVFTAALPSLSDRAWVEDLIPEHPARHGVGHFELVRSDLAAAHRCEVAQDLEVILLHELRKPDGTAPSVEDLLDACATHRMPVRMSQRRAWWPTARVTPRAFRRERWEHLVDSHVEAHVVVVRDALLPAARTAMSLLNANVHGSYLRGEAVLVLDSHPWELAMVPAWQAAVLREGGVAASEWRAAELVNGLAHAERWSFELDVLSATAHRQWARLLLPSAPLAADVFLEYWSHADAATRARPLEPTHEGDGEATRWGPYGLIPERDGLKWQPRDVLEPARVAQAPDLEPQTLTLLPTAECFLVAARGAPERFRVEPSAVLFQAFPGAFWRDEDGVAEVEWRVPGGRNTHTPHRDAGIETDAATDADFVLPLRRIQIEQAGRLSQQRVTLASPASELPGESVRRDVLFICEATVRARVHAIGTATFNRDGALRTIREREQRAPTGVRDSFETQALFIYDREHPFTEADAVASAAQLRLALATLQPVTRVLCDVFAAELLVLDRSFGDGWAVCVLDGVEGGAGIARQLANRASDLRVALAIATSDMNRVDLALLTP